MESYPFKERKKERTKGKDKNMVKKLVLKLDVMSSSGIVYLYHIYPTPPLGQDMTKGQFLSEV